MTRGSPEQPDVQGSGIPRGVLQLHRQLHRDGGYHDRYGQIGRERHGSGTYLLAASSSSAGTVVLSIAINRTAAMQTGTWTSSTAGMSGSISVTNGTAMYLTTTNTGSNQGTFTLNITKVPVLTTTANGTALYL